MNGRRIALAERRRTLGLSQEDLAARLRVDRSTVARWERGHTAPQPWQRPALARALALSPDELTDLLNSEHRQAAGLPTDFGASADEIHRELTRLEEAYSSTPAIMLLSTTAARLAQLTQLREQSLSVHDASELDRSYSRALTLMGQLVWDASQRRDHTAARDYFEQAANAARRAHDPTLEARALLRFSFIALYGQNAPRLGLALTTSAAKVSRRVSPVIGALTHLHAAEAHAMLGSATECRRSLAAAETDLGAHHRGDPAEDLYSSSVRGRMVGSCLLRLGDYQAALAELDEASTCAAPLSKSKALIVANSALALARSGDADGAAERLEDAVDLIEITRGGGALNLAFQAGRELHQKSDGAATKNVVDRLMSLMAG